MKKINPREQTDSALPDRSFRPAIIFGQRNKLTAEGPFLDLLRAFQQRLSHADRLTVVGYSFRDPHVNEYITEWINVDSRRTLRIIDPNFPTRDPGSPISDVSYPIQLFRYCGDCIDVYAEPAGSALKKLVKQ